MARALALAWPLLCGLAASAAAQGVCEQAGRVAEQQAGLPAGLLGAIGRVESGHHPWSLDAAGEDLRFAGREEAVAETRRRLAAGQRNLDGGCFQVNLMYHPRAFADLEQAFDPAANAAYAARFLLSLRARLGSWAAAVAAYHSATPWRGQPYRDLVYAAWNGGAAPTAPAIPAAAEVPAALSFVANGVHVWGPSLPGAAPQVVAMPAVAGREAESWRRDPG